ncbi:MAG: hypothetical protein D6798_11250 [Deltaproteobacteria bacterium]|nr:MAG: hypothetical protein D6798_11250 [Deltaproteobacteria bacterium]
MSAARPPPHDIVEMVDRLFCGPRSPYGPFNRSDEGEIVVPGVLYRFALSDSDRRRLALQLYKGLNTVGGALWTREVRSLLRLSARGHPAIPSIHGGAYVERDDVAFVITEAAQYRLSEDGAMGFVAERPEQALRQLTLLAHGLSLLHEQGITHRNLHPGSIEYVEYGEDHHTGEVRFGLRLSRFEMSAMVSNLVRRQLSGERLDTGDLRAIYLVDNSSTLHYTPPERAAWLFGGTDAAVLESDRSDVYSLGVLAWRWLVEPALAADPAFAGTPIDWTAPMESIDDLRQVQRSLQASTRSSQVPRTLGVLLASMLAWDPRDRPSIFSVLQDLTQHYGRLVASLAAPEDSATYFVGFMPVQSKKTIYRWGWIDQDPEEDEGREQLRAFLEVELKGAELLYCPEGFSGFKRASTERELKSFKAAKYVLVGKQAYWFCDIWRQRGPAFSRADNRIDQFLVIKYVRHHHRAWRLSETPLRRRVPGRLRFLPAWTDRPLDLTEVRANGKSWKPLIQSVEFERNTPDWMRQMDDALSFLLAFRQTELEARVFPYVVARRSGEVVDIQLDRVRDQKHQYADAMRSLYFREIRIPMGRLFQGLDGETTAPLAIYGDAGDRPDYRNGPVAKVVFHRWLDDDTVSVRLVDSRGGIPDSGWVRPDDDAGSYSQLRRQEEAVNELMKSRALLHQLHAPTAIKGIRNRWRGVGDSLAGRSGGIVKDMLSTEPFYGLHGPPGTGKTTVASVAVAAHLRADPSERVLISSQSHYALDNLARRVLRHCKQDGLDVVAVRVASDHAVAGEKVHPEVEHLLPDRQASARVEGIRRSVERALASGQLRDGRLLDGDLKKLLGQWKEQAPRVELEVRDRIRRGANLVFATTGGCTPRNVATGGTSGQYDWVIVEEAARAWPTELALPLVRGLRWSLIGDHFQLPAFDELSVERFLQACTESEIEELKAHGENRPAYLEAFKLFGNLFDKRASRRKQRPSSSRLVEPLDELDLQFRMHPDICRIVSRAFYRVRIDPDTGEERTYPDGWLRTHEETTNNHHGLHSPNLLAGRALVWLDTEGVENTNDQRAWKNEGEARLIRTLLERLRPAPSEPKGDDDESFALLSPYNAQLEELGRAGLPSWTRGRLHTVDSFQGREADIVVVSMVRSTQREDRRPEANIGYLVSPNRVNVLLSRARQLLVIVGRLGHFERQVLANPDRPDIAFWKAIADELRSQNAVVSGVALGGGGRP